jgi:hypothetical protein
VLDDVAQSAQYPLHSPSDAIPHFLEYDFHVMHAQPVLARSLKGLERVKLARSDLIALDRIRLNVKSAHVFDKGSRYGGRYFQLFPGRGCNIGEQAANRSPK